MSTIFMNSENSKTSDGHGLRLKVKDKMDLRRSDNLVELSVVVLQGYLTSTQRKYPTPLPSL